MRYILYLRGNTVSFYMLQQGQVLGVISMAWHSWLFVWHGMRPGASLHSKTPLWLLAQQATVLWRVRIWCLLHACPWPVAILMVTAAYLNFFLKPLNRFLFSPHRRSTVNCRHPAAAPKPLSKHNFTAHPKLYEGRCIPFISAARKASLMKTCKRALG